MAATDAEPAYADMAAGDPFTSSTSSHRYSNFDNQLFALGPTTSPEQAKRALEAHLAETERRIQDASKLGTTLVQQRKELADRLKEIEKQQDEGEITPELRQKLVEIEKEYNEVGRESARAFLPKSRVSSSEMAGSPYPVEGKVNGFLFTESTIYMLTIHAAFCEPFQVRKSSYRLSFQAERTKSQTEEPAVESSPRYRICN